MKVKLGLSDRFALHSVLPTEAHILELKAIKPLREGLLPNALEQRDAEMKINDRGQPQWPMEKEPKPRTFEIEEIVFDIVRRALKKLEEKGTLREGHLHIYEVFVEKDYNKKDK